MSYDEYTTIYDRAPYIKAIGKIDKLADRSMQCSVASMVLGTAIMLLSVLFNPIIGPICFMIGMGLSFFYFTPRMNEAFRRASKLIDTAGRIARKQLMEEHNERVREINEKYDAARAEIMKSYSVTGNGDNKGLVN